MLKSLLAIILVALLAASPARAALVFNFNVPDAGKAPSADALAGFNAAAAIWSAAVTDNITLNYDLYWEPLSAGVVGSASSSFCTDTYSNVRAAMVSDAGSTDDSTSSGALSAGSFDFYINETTDNPNGSGSATPFVDSGNTNIRMTRANAKALGLVAAADATTDADIRFSSSFSFDFDRSDGIDGGKMDFIGVAVHEIGHSLGFTSGVDLLDGNADSFSSDVFDDYVSVLDLFRYSPESVTAGGTGTLDWAADTRTKYFSLDSGVNKVDGLTFSTGVNYGDGQQNSHWKDNQGIGALDPTISYGEQIDLTDNDLRGFDVIGWDLAAGLSAAVTSSLLGASVAPEPIAMVPLGLGLIALRLTGRQRRSL